MAHLILFYFRGGFPKMNLEDAVSSVSHGALIVLGPKDEHATQPKQPPPPRFWHQPSTEEEIKTKGEVQAKEEEAPSPAPPLGEAAAHNLPTNPTTQPSTSRVPSLLFLPVAASVLSFFPPYSLLHTTKNCTHTYDASPLHSTQKTPINIQKA